MGEIIQIRDVDPYAGGFVEVDAPAPEMSAERYTLVIRRGSASEPFLGINGWQQVEYAFAARDMLVKNGRLLLTFGPEIVDNALQHDDVVEVNIPELGFSDVVVWEGITRSISLIDEAADTKEPTPGRAAPLPPPLIGAIEKTEADTDEIEEDSDGDDNQDEFETDVLVDPDIETDRRKPYPVLYALVIAALLVGIGSFYYWPKGALDNDSDTVAVTPIEPIEDDGAAPTPEPLAPIEAAYQRGVAAFKADQCSQARDNLVEAMNLGSDKAALFWAENTDSVDFDGCLADTSNDIQALKRYQIACEAGLEGAPEKLALLEGELIRRRDDEGDVVASQVLSMAFNPVQAACNE